MEHLENIWILKEERNTGLKHISRTTDLHPQLVKRRGESLDGSTANTRRKTTHRETLKAPSHAQFTAQDGQSCG